MKITGLSQEEIHTLIPREPILVGYRGSIAHGMYVPNSDPRSIDDKDIMAVCIPGSAFYFADKFNKNAETSVGFSNRGVYEKWIREYDSVSYDVKKFVLMAANSNPNVLSLLYLPDQYYIHRTPLGQMLIDSRELFLSKQIYFAYTGYAHGQIHKMTAMAFEGYMGEKRKHLVEQFGYDTKNAAHAIRLLRMGIELLNDGKMYVDRSKIDSPQLMDIKMGRWTIEQVKAEADHLFKRAEGLYDRCTLPFEPDRAKVENLLVRMFATHFNILNPWRGAVE